MPASLLALFAAAFAIGTSEFVIAGILPAVSTDLAISIPTAGLLVSLYALLFVLLNLEAWSLLIGSVLLFAALAGVMYATRNVDWNNVGRYEPAPE